MSYVPKMLKNSPSENVDEKNGNTKTVGKDCLSLDLNQSLEDMDPQLNLVLNSKDTTNLKPSEASEPLHSRPVNHEGVEYSCNFCTKKFYNKQALGGHQNAHKIEKVIQKRAWKGHLGYTGKSSGNGMTSFAFPNSFNQAPKMMSPHYPQSMHHQIYAHGYPGFMSPMPHESGAIPMSHGSGVIPMSHESGVMKLGVIPTPHQSGVIPMPHESGVTPMSHESGVMKLGSFCTSPKSPQFMSFQKRMEHGASTSKGKSIAIEKNDHAEHYRQINDAKSQHHEDDLDLSLKL